MLAALACQAQVERFAHLLACASRRSITSPWHHLEQQVRAAAGGVHLLARRLVARAHRLPAVVSAAFADPDAALGRLRKAAVVVGVLEVGLDRAVGAVARPEAQVRYRAGTGR